MGRRKIEIKSMENQRLITVSSTLMMIAQVTLHKRLKGLTKKAMEMSLLTGVEINLTVYNKEAGRMLQYVSTDDVE